MITKEFNVHKLEKNSHLYTSDKLVNNFPEMIKSYKFLIL